VWRLADGAPVGEPLTGHTGDVSTVAVGALPDSTPVIVSGSDDVTVRVWRLADGAPVGEPLTGHTGDVNAVAVGALADGTPVIVSGSDDATVRVAAGRRHPSRTSPAPTGIGMGCRRSRQHHRHCRWGQHRRPPTSNSACR
jgi:WD40 repeat protein